MILHEVVTTEKVPFSYRVAGLGVRYLAWLVDAACMVLLGFAGALFSVGLAVLDKPGLAQGLMLVWVFALVWCYFLLFEWLWQGQTPGKRLLGIRVIQSRGTAVSFYQSAARNLVRIVDALPFFYGVGFLVAALNRENRRLGDLAADTLVVHVERHARPVFALPDARTEADRSRLALWRQRLSQLERGQKQTLLDLCLRRDQLRIAERARLFQSAAQFFEERLGLAPDAFESAEKFVLQLAAVLGERPGEGQEERATGSPHARGRR